MIHRCDQVHGSGIVQNRGRPRLFSAEEEHELLGLIAEMAATGVQITKKIIEDVVCLCYSAE